MPLTFNADGSLETEPVGDRGARQPTQANRDALGDGEQTMRLLGPFHIAHDTPGLLVSNEAGNFDTFVGVEITTLTADQLIVQAMVRITEAWDGGSQLDLASSTGRGNTFFNLNPMDGVSFDDGKFATLDLQASAFGPQLVLVDDAVHAIVNHNDGTAPTTGEADIYLLIAEPA